MKQSIPFLRRTSWPMLGFVVLFAIVGTLLLFSSHAATPISSIEAENGVLGGAATIQTDSQASSGHYVQFGTASSGGGGSNMIVALNGGGWGPSGITDQLGAAKYIRVDWAFNPQQDIKDIAANGGKAIVDFSGTYYVATNKDKNQTPGVAGLTSGADASLTAASWASNTLAWYKSNCIINSVSACPMIEILNEPSGDWFWGPGSDSQANALAYANLIKTTYLAIHGVYGSSSPLILASYDNSNWAGWWWSSSMSAYIDGIIVHPYGGTGSTSTSKLGDRQLVTNAHTLTNKPVYITEVGWPTAVGHPATGDSLQWPESSSTPGSTAGDQCNNTFNFISWARGTGFVNAVVDFGYRDYTSGSTYAWYGIERWQEGGGTVDASHKPAFDALHSASINATNPCPNPVTY